MCCFVLGSCFTSCTVNRDLQSTTQSGKLIRPSRKTASQPHFRAAICSMQHHRLPSQSGRRAGSLSMQVHALDVHVHEGLLLQICLHVATGSNQRQCGLYSGHCAARCTCLSAHHATMYVQCYMYLHVALCAARTYTVRVCAASHPVMHPAR